MRRIGYLTSSAPDASASVEGFQQFRLRLRELGYFESQNLVIEHRHPVGGAEEFGALANELVGIPVEVIVVGDSRAIPTVKAATSTIPIVMTISGDVVGLGLAPSLAQPGGNLTGVTQGDTFRPLDKERLELLLEVVPGASRVAVLWNSAHPGVARDFQNAVVPVVAMLERTLVSLEVKTAQEIETVVGAANLGPGDVLYVMPDPLTNLHAQQIVDLAAQHRLPAMYGTRLFADAGGLLYWGRSRKAMSRRAADFVDRILKGYDPPTLPIELPPLFEFVINLGTARALGLTIPDNVLRQATEVRN